MPVRPGKFQISGLKVWGVLISLQLLLNGCIILPVPWFPTDPHKKPLAVLAERDVVTREEILRKWGAPWASVGDHNLIYIADKTSSNLVLFGYGGGGDLGPMTQRDFIVSFFFDNEGVMKRFETYADTGNHDHCFADGVCFTKETRNVPLVPERVDKEAKQFQAPSEQCVIYVYRSPFINGSSYKEYVDIRIGKAVGTSKYQAKSIGASVPGGYFRWEFESGHFYYLIADFEAVKKYPFVTHFTQHKREAVVAYFQCKPGQLIYASLVVPKSKSKNPQWNFISPGTAQESIRNSRMLAGRVSPLW